MDDKQLLKGVLEGCVLAIISRKETYGYELIVILREYGFEDIQEGTLYPILTRLEKKGYIRARGVRSEIGPIRKYFSITAVGRYHLSQFVQSYAKLTQRSLKILKEVN
ncbi:PadR family transcriptional regulator [Erysipelothrix larvae]|uniref:PadR family transcriptional regulator n=1 Tax=Erysipelothrix larvae TaxID=1514105 RepID=A0A0X8GZR8_9FIRM|nr:PadR family transcriptional regulator [Erysipelothrix larvae]AMC93380.1 PadR family transcriptional regulator [Erysipelothrix larvae]